MDIQAEKLELMRLLLATDSEKVLSNVKALLVKYAKQGESAQEEIKEHDLVTAIATIGTIPKGAKGVVVHIYADGDNCEVEFVVKGKSIVQSVPISQITKE
jgi:tagatose-1,6-bisphosphate aldolase